MNEITSHSQLNPEQKAFIFMYSALKKPLTEVKTDFQQFFGEIIKGEVIMQTQKRFAKEIEEKSKQELNDINQVPIAHARVRLEFLYKALQLACTPRIVGSHKVSDREYEPEWEVNHAAIAKYLDLAQKEEYLAKKLYYELLKNKDVLGDSKPSSGFKPVLIDSGLEEWDEIQTQ